MSDDPTPWDNATESATAVPGEVSPQDGYVLLLALLSIFIGGTLVLLSGILIICRRCCEADHRHSRASDDPEKTNTTYLDDSQPAQDITIKVEDPDCLSSSSYRDAESERFLSSSSSTARRVSFNEAALFEQSKKTQEKGRRYTLTEGDFHHLKNARLTHLHLPPPALKIVTIHECESSENSLAMTPCLPPPKPGLAIFQPPAGALPQPALPSHAVCPSSALPGDTYNSTVDTSFTEASPSASSDSGEGPSFTAAPRSGKVVGTGSAGPGEPPPAPAQGTVLQFFTRLRRHASLDGASPYFRIKKWKLESTQRASSLDTRGSPKRRQFQRQRAASESMDQEDQDPHQTDIIQYIAHTDDVAFHPAGGPFLPSPASPPPSLGSPAPTMTSGACAPRWSCTPPLSGATTRTRCAATAGTASPLLAACPPAPPPPWTRPKALRRSSGVGPSQRSRSRARASCCRWTAAMLPLRHPAGGARRGPPRTRRPQRSAFASPARGGKVPSLRASRAGSQRRRKRKRRRRRRGAWPGVQRVGDPPTPTAPWPGPRTGRCSRGGMRCPGGTTASTRRQTPCSMPSCATTPSSTSHRCGGSTAPAPTSASSGSTPSSTATPACATPRWSGTAPPCAVGTVPTTPWMPASTAPCPALSVLVTRRRRRRLMGSPPPRRCPTLRSR
ncbi:voltage-dependent calcium channel beta subunit-associated regulatory protein isoform X3 [Grus americana]|uniref:voltage-dependent calcium channel beta subunit-associated regulatory protein isoform X3 n=1 Tax=Grus americana TaxID=9117 RepID=UPI002407DDC7|nr:voltage-dependent calcium channel beta subunit-associated regulatory protein isoform X3 [Grus americana]